MDSDPDGDLEIINKSDIPTDPNTQPSNDSPTSSDYGSDEIPGGGLDVVRNSERMLRSFIPVVDNPIFTEAADTITKPTDLNSHNKTKSEALNTNDMFNFFKIAGDTASESDDENIDAAKTKEKRATSMAGISNLEYDPQNPLNFENLRLHTEQDAATSPHDIDEEKTAQPLDTLSVHSNHGSEHSKLELNVEDHIASNEHDITVEERIEPITNADSNGWQMDDEYNHNYEQSMDTTPGVPDETVSMPMGAPKHVKRASIQDLVTAQLLQESANDPEMSAALQQDMSANTMAMMMGTHGNDDEDNMMMNGVMGNENGTVEGGGGIGYFHSDEIGSGHGVESDAQWMATMKKMAENERNLRKDIAALEMELDQTQNDMDDAEHKTNAMRVQYETQISQMEQRESEMKESYEKEIDEMKSDHVMAQERMRSDNQTMAQDVTLLRQEVQSHKTAMDELQSQLVEAQQQYEEVKTTWDLHREECPLLNEEIARRVADEKQQEIQKWKLGSQQMDERVGQLLTAEKEAVDEIERLKEENASKQEMLETNNMEISSLQERLDQLSAEHHKSTGALQETRLRADEEQRQRLETESKLRELENQYDMLCAYSNEQAQVLEQAQMVPAGVDPQQFEAVKTKRALFRPSNAGNKRSIVRSLGGMDEFAEHMRTLSNVSGALRSGRLNFQYDEKDDYTDTASNYSSASTDFGSVASHFTRYSFRPYHVHDAPREFFFLLALCVKLSLAHKYGISPDVAPSNDSLWSMALQQNIKFHEYPSFLQNELTNLYEYKFKARQGTIHNVVITDLTKIRQKKEHNDKVKDLKRKMETQSYLYSQYENYTKGSGSVENHLRAIKDRTYFSPNDDLFGGHTKVTTRAHRNQRMQSKRSRDSIKSTSSNRSHRVHRDRDRHRNSSSHHKHKKRAHKSGSREPGNRKDAQNHPLNANPDRDVKRRNSGKLSSKPITPNGGSSTSKQRQRRHLTQESLDHLDPIKNPHI